MHARRAAPRSEPTRDDAAARRLALIAADLGSPSAAEGSAPTAAPDTEPAWWADHTRVVAQPAQSVQPVPPGEPGAAQQSAEPPAVPRPGRHAARRRTGLRPPWRRPRPAGSGLLAVGPAHVAVVAVLVAVGLAATTWWVVRDEAQPVSAVSAEPVAPLVGAPTPAGAPSSAAAPAASSGASPASVTVDVAGKVRRPGIVVLDQGARVADALRAAGGARRGVDLTSVNLARVLVDGEQIVVGAPPGAQPVAPGAPPASGGGAPAPGGPLVNLNTASQAELETLPGVGPVTAQSILAWREQHGGFSSVDELLEVDGIGDKTLATLTPHVTV